MQKNTQTPAARSAGAMSTKALVKNYFVGWFPDAKKVKVKRFYNKKWQVLIYIERQDGHIARAWVRFRNTTLPGLLSAKLDLYKKMERFCI